jgi:hypothetical protein
MLLIFLQILGVCLLLAYVSHWRKQQWKRGKKSWDEIVAGLSDHGWGIEDISERYLYKSGIRATTQDIWQRITGCSGLWAMYKNAPILVELADYAAKHGDGIDPELLDRLRRDAFQIRLFVLLALVQHATQAYSSGAAQNAHRATVIYSGMLASLTEFMQEHSALLFPRYLDAVA